jgi:hypothetical protein
MSQLNITQKRGKIGGREITGNEEF